MAKVNSFTQLSSWQLAKKLICNVYTITSARPASKDFQFCDQLRRAALSVMNNIAEGFDRYNPKEFQRFLNYSIGSCGEVISMLYLARDLKYCEENMVRILIKDFSNLKGKLIKLKQSQIIK